MIPALGWHHLHKRKRRHKKLLKYPHPDRRIRFLDKLLMLIAIIGPLMTIPQIWKIFVNQDASGVSLLSWGMYTVFNIPWIVYGFVHKEKPIYIGYILWFIVNLLVVIGTIIY